MNRKDVRFTLSFSGNDSDRNEIDFYDVSQALIGFQRSLALTTHLVLNNEIITQSPYLKGAAIYAIPPEPGSWRFAAVISIAGGIYAAGTAPNNSPLGHIIFSLYDYVISESLGVHVDYDKSIGQLYEEGVAKRARVKEARESQADSLIEKCSTAIREMHRPIYKNGTATTGSIVGRALGGKDIPLHTGLTQETYEFINETRVSEEIEYFSGKISSYNSNTFKGRIYIEVIGRPVSFELSESARDSKSINLITSSLRANALRRTSDAASVIHIAALRNTSKSGTLKSLTVSAVASEPFK